MEPIYTTANPGLTRSRLIFFNHHQTAMIVQYSFKGVQQMSLSLTLADKDPRESKIYSIDFTPSLMPNEPIASVTPSVLWIQGPGDANPSAMLSGSPVIMSTHVQQKLTGGVSGNTYELNLVVITSAGETLVGVGRLTVSTV